jgi:hypothetical protein
MGLGLGALCPTPTSCLTDTTGGSLKAAGLALASTQPLPALQAKRCPAGSHLCE